MSIPTYEQRLTYLKEQHAKALRELDAARECVEACKNKVTNCYNAVRKLIEAGQ